MLYYQKNTIKPTTDPAEIKEQIRGFYQDTRKYTPGITPRLFTHILESASLLKNGILQQEEIFNHPDAIDNGQYWRDLFQLGKFMPISQQIGWAESERSAKKTVMRGQSFFHLSTMTDLLDGMLAKISKPVVLEIGPGYGWNHRHLERRYRRLGLEIHAMDYAMLYSHQRLHQTNGKEFPSDIPDELDLVYSINCFQHFSFKQKTLYYREIVKRFAPDGIFFFSDFCLHPQAPQNGFIRTRDGRAVMTFATQFNDMYESFDEMRKHLDENGLQIERVNHTVDGNIYVVAKKKTKLDVNIDVFDAPKMSS